MGQDRKNNQVKYQVLQITVLHTKKQGLMFKRCHSLKRSQLKIPQPIKEKSRIKKHIETQQCDKQNIVTNYKYSNVLLIKSIEYSKQRTMTTLQQSNIRSNTLCSSRLVSVQKIKQLCKEIDTVNQKIQMYREILYNKEMRHEKNRIIKMEKKEIELGKLIEQYQKIKMQNQRLVKQLDMLGVEEMQISDKDIEDKRRTTATFNFIFHR